MKNENFNCARFLQKVAPSLPYNWQTEENMDIKQKTRKEKTISLFDRIDARTSESTVKKIMEINDDDRQYSDDLEKMAREYNITIGSASHLPITLLLSTPGGSCYDGMAIYDAVTSSETPVEVVCSGKIMSMGVIVALAASVRKAYRNTTFMIHQVSGMVLGCLHDMEESIDETRRINELLFSIIESKTNITRDMLNDIAEKKKDWYMTAEEALKLGIITEII